MSKKAIILSVSFITLVLVLFSSFWILSIRSSQEETKYLEEMQSTVYQMSLSIINSSEISSSYLKYWDSFNQYDRVTVKSKNGISTTYTDINDLISSRVQSKKQDIDKIINDKEVITSNLKNLNKPPKIYLEAYNLIVEMYQLYSDAVDNAESPSGSYITYTQSVETILTDFTKKHEEFNLKY
ncbi:monomeric isocitrate dehydrogenase [Fontibacillus solani]|uniref:Monomeric isocitrate dehydrogenase n=1 Tax=Fontibacillus solani TaxID=1572857 RepID=A0A7W3XTQ7_9BACL|nr:hypothetical protein [Fontibacillus solani]MBA9088037.1 monomeric isocitrate dehydrogenase [Fontibacillus solani]